METARLAAAETAGGLGSADIVWTIRAVAAETADVAVGSDVARTVCVWPADLRSDFRFPA